MVKSVLDSPALVERNRLTVELFASLAHLTHQRQLEIVAAWLPLASLRACHELNVVEKRALPSLTYFIGGTPHVGRIRDGRWIDGFQPDDDVRSYGGSHAGPMIEKWFTSQEARLRFLNRMAEIYGDRFYARGDDPSDQRFYSRRGKEWVL